MQIQYKESSRGFTLIEVVVYIALISIVIGYSTSGDYTLIRDSERLNARVIIDAEANFLLKKIEWALSSVQNITNPSSGFSDDSLSIERYNFSANNPVVFDLDSDGNLRITVGVNTEILNSELINVDNLLFEHIAPNGDRPAGLKTSMDVNRRTYEMTLYQNR